MKVLMRERDLSDDYIRFAAQIGADGLDVHQPDNIPGVMEQGYADEAGVRKLLERLRGWGLGVYRVAPPTPERYLLGQPGGDAELDDLCRTLEALAKAGVPFMSMPVLLGNGHSSLSEKGANPGRLGDKIGVHRGGYRMYTFDPSLMRRRLAEDPPEFVVDIEAHYQRSLEVYRRLVPIAEAYDIKLIIHPADPPIEEAEFGPSRWFKIIDDVPSDHSGFLYCIGTRFESGTDIYEEIRSVGRRGKIFHTHFRNVRGTIPSTGGYEEVALDDGDMSMFRVLQTLKSVGFDGGLQIDHLPNYDGDNRFQGMASGFAVGYVKGLLAALGD